MTAIQQLLTRMKTNNTLACCGLDPDLSKMPREIVERNTSDGEKILAFLTSVVDVTAQHVCSYKAQKAFFDVLPEGHDVLQELIGYIHLKHEGIPVILDCKIGDIDNTMEAYVRNLFGLLKADGLVINPYMGDDVMEPLAEQSDKAIVVLAKTSNPSGGVVQDVILQNGQPLWQYILGLTVNRWNRNGNMIPVVSSTVGLDMRYIRALIPDGMPILLAGIGAQGGSYAELAKLLNSERSGVFVNSSRGILYPKSDKPWLTGIENAVIALKQSLNNERNVQ